MQLYNMLDLATQNATTLKSSYQGCCACIDDTLRHDFEQHLKNRAEVTVAVFSGFAFEEKQGNKMVCAGRDDRGLILSKVLEIGKYLNAYERYQTDEEREAHFSKFKDERAILDSSFTEGRKFKYFNFNNGQLGIPAFGDFTLAFTLDYFLPDKFIFLKYNSLRRADTSTTQCYYFTTNNEAVDTHKLIQDLATVDNFVELIVLKCEKELQEKENLDFNILILKPIDGKHKHRDYVEVIVWQDVVIDKGVKLRASRQRYDALVDEISNVNTTLGAEVRNIAELQALIDKNRREKQLIVEMV